MTSFPPFTLLFLIDLIVMGGSLYFFLYILKRTQIQNFFAVVVAFICSYSISKMLGLTLFPWLIEQFFVIFVVFIFVIFQNEIRICNFGNVSLIDKARNRRKLNAGKCT